MTLGGKAYTIKPLPLRQARQMRERFKDTLGTLANAIGQAEKVDVGDLQSLSCLFAQVSDVIVGSLDTLADWLFVYSPELAEDRERILDNATDDEVVTAFMAVLEQLYPFGGLRTVLNGLPGRGT